jgi:hypothetical protein
MPKKREINTDIMDEPEPQKRISDKIINYQQKRQF